MLCSHFLRFVKFIYSEKATKFCEIFPLLWTTVHTVKSKGKISQTFMAFSEYMNFTNQCYYTKYHFKFTFLLFLIEGTKMISSKRTNA